jgi:hypothetical protein
MNVNVAGRDVTVRELTIGQMRDWLTQIATAPQSNDILNTTLFESITLPELCMVTDLLPNELESFTPTQLAPLVQAYLDVNSRWFKWRNRIIDTANELRKRQAEHNQQG